MLKVRSQKKNGLVLDYVGRDNSQTIDLIVDPTERDFIRANLPNIAFDVTNQKFYVTQDGKRGRTRTTLQRAIVRNAGKKKMPERLARREDKFDFRLSTLTA